MALVLDLQDVTVWRGNNTLLDSVSWRVEDWQRWVIIGPNGAGKSTLVAVASANLFPSSGVVKVLGEQLGKVDVFELRPRIGITSSLLAGRVPGVEKAGDLVVSASYGIVGHWREPYDDVDYDRAHDLMSRMRVSHLADREFGTLSEGERKRVLIARSMMSDPELLFMDEPGAGLDLAGREILVSVLAELCTDVYAPTTVLVTHNVEDIPNGVTHAMLLKAGKVAAAGPIAEVLTDENMSSCFDMPLKIDNSNGRWTCFATNTLNLSKARRAI